MSHQFQIDGVRVGNRPRTLRWQPPRLLGVGGRGAPVYGSYWTCSLGFSTTTVVQLQHWYDAMDGESHTIRLPHPITGEWTDFSDVFVRLPQSNFTVDHEKVAATGVDFDITNITVTV